MNTSRHAEVRMQQRAIPATVVELLIRYGSKQHAQDHASIVYFDKKGKNRLAMELNIDTYKKVEPKLDTFLIVRDGLIITVGHRHKRIKRNI